MGEQQPPADGAQHGEDQGPARRAEPARADGPLEDAEGDDEKDEDPVLQYLGVREALPEALRTQRPGARVVPDQQEQGEPEEEEGPMARPAPPAGLADGEDAHGEN